MTQAPKPRVTQTDVARAAGVSRSAVSLALKGTNKLSPETRSRILAAIVQLGYVPDPLLSALSSYSAKQPAPSHKGTLVWLAQSVPHHPWREVHLFREFLHASQEHAKARGFTVEVMDVAEMGITWQRAGEIANARGVLGVFIGPHVHPGMRIEAFPWERFSCVTFGHSIVWPPVHSVAPAHYRSGLRLMWELRRRGYERVGLVIDPKQDERLDFSFGAAYRVGWTQFFQGEPLPICHAFNRSREAELIAWAKQHRIDAVISASGQTGDSLADHGYRIPEDVGMVCTSCVPEGEHPIAGIYTDPKRIGKIAVDLMVSMIQRGERGIPEYATRTLVDCLWLERSSVRPVSPGAALQPPVPYSFLPVEGPRNEGASSTGARTQ